LRFAAKKASRLKPLPTTKRQRENGNRNPRPLPRFALVVGRAFRLDAFRQVAEKLMLRNLPQKTIAAEAASYNEAGTRGR
jgi:hypothetical protein